MVASRALKLGGFEKHASCEEASSDVSDVLESSSLSCSELFVTYDKIQGLIPLK